MNLPLSGYLAVALALSMAGNAWQLFRAGGAKPRCEAATAVATVKADQAVRRDETKRDTALDLVTTETKADTRKAVGQVQEETHARADAIARIPVYGACRAPDGLPDLGPAVDQANVAAGD